jgi:hypothetical protein
MATTTNFGWTTPDDTSLVKDGASAIRTLGSSIDTSLGGAWTSWTPTFTNVTLGNGTTTAKFKQINKTVIGYVLFKLGSTSAITGEIKTTFPVTPTTILSGAVHYLGMILDDSVGYIMSFPVVESSNINVYAALASGTYVTRASTSSTVPMTWTTNDAFYVSFVYEAL